MKFKFHFHPKPEREMIPVRFIVDYTLSNIAYFLVVSSVIPKLTDYYNIPLALANLIVGIPSALGFAELIGGLVYNNTGNRPKYIRTVGIAWRMFLPMTLLAVLLPIKIGAVVMVASYFFMSLSQHLSNPGYNAWMISSTKGIINQNFYSNRDMVFMIIFSVLSLLAGYLINYSEGVGNIKGGFIIYGIVVLIFAVASLPYLIKRLPEPPKEEVQKTSLLKVITDPIKDKMFFKVMLFHITWTFFSVLWSNFAGVYQVRVLDLNYLFITVSGTIASVIRIICIPLFAKMAEKTSWKAATMLSMGIMALHCVSWCFTTADNATIMFPITTILGSVPWAAMGIGMFKYQIAYSNDSNRSVYLSATSTLTGLTALIAGFASSALVEALELMFEVPPFWVIFAVGFAGVLLTIFLIYITPYKETD